MDPITIGVAVGTAVVSQLARKLMEKAADPEKVARGVNWVFSAVDHFLKIRRQGKQKGAAVAPPPPPAPKMEPPAEVKDSEVEAKANAVKVIAKSLPSEDLSTAEAGVRLLDMDDFAMQQLADEVSSLLTQLKTYLDNLRFTEEKVALYGGLPFATTLDMNTIRIQQEEIAKRVSRLNHCMQKAYGVAAPDLELLVTVTQSL